jgi:glycosyltransferase involved in cell wall biosynthesis
MKIIIFHYHLNPGGVTRIIELQAQTLVQQDNNIEVEIITGHCENPAFFEQMKVKVSVFPELNYLLPKQTDFKTRYNKINKFFSDICRKENILHFHNLNLGKNPLVTLAISKMAQNGFQVINHAHDFAEDRPVNENFLKQIIEGEFKEELSSILYPEFSNYTYAVLNSFDLNRLVEYGVAKSRINLLPNPVDFSASRIPGTKVEWKNEISKELSINPDKKLITYPVRVIRRKNIGEFVLFALLFFEEANWVVTQPPKNPVEIEPYEKWKEFCKQEKIHVCWEAGTKCDFEKLLKASDFCLTTSIQEGFGMVFLEPWLLGTAVKGRNIPMVTDDIIASGLEFPGLYDRFIVSDGKQLHEHTLTEQFEIIREIKNDKEKKRKLFESNAFLEDLLKPVEEALINRNNKVILSNYSLKNYGKKLNEIYRRIIT